MYDSTSLLLFLILIYVLIIGKWTDVMFPLCLQWCYDFVINNNMNMKHSTSTLSIYSIIYMIPHNLFCSYFVNCDSRVHPLLIWYMYQLFANALNIYDSTSFLLFLFCIRWFKGAHKTNFDMCINYSQMYWIYMIPHYFYFSYFVTCVSKTHPILMLICLLIIDKCTEYIWIHIFFIVPTLSPVIQRCTQ